MTNLSYLSIAVAKVRIFFGITSILYFFSQKKYRLLFIICYFSCVVLYILHSID